MKHVFLILLALLLPTLIRADEPVQVPRGVRYAAATDAINDVARQALRERFKADASDEDVRALFEEMLICGPGIWHAIKDDENVARIKGGKLSLKIPVQKPDGSHSHFDTMEGKVFRTPEQVLIFWKAFIKQADLKDLKIRKLNPQELTIFWKMIPFDISEPLFMMESEKHKLLVLFLSPTDRKPDQKVKVMWIDDFQSIRLIDKPKNEIAGGEK